MRNAHGTPGVRPPLTFAGGEGGDHSRIIFLVFNTLLNRPFSHDFPEFEHFAHCWRQGGAGAERPRRANAGHHAAPHAPGPGAQWWWHTPAPRRPTGPTRALGHNPHATRPRAVRMSQGNGSEQCPTAYIAHFAPLPPDPKLPNHFPVAHRTPSTRVWPRVQRTSAMPGPTWVDRFLSSNAARLDPRRAHEILREFRGEPLQNAGGIEPSDGGSPAGDPSPNPRRPNS